MKQIQASLILSGDVESNPGPGDGEDSRITRSRSSVEDGRSTRSGLCCSKNLVSLIKEEKKLEQKQTKKTRKRVHFEVNLID